jgi:AcrR family transcriptional regulator
LKLTSGIAEGSEDVAKTTPRKPVTRDRAVSVAIGLADGGGIEALSMRKLARELDVEAMSLYYHVKSKDDLVDAMVDFVFSEISLPESGDEWKKAMREHAESTRSALTRHPWAISLIDSRTTPGAETLRHLDAMIGCLLHAGFSMAMAGHAMSVVDSYIRGFALQETSLPLSDSGSIGEATESIMEQQHMMSQAFPNLAAMAVELILQPGYAYGDEFAFGLGLILDGLESRTTSHGP